MLIEEYEMATTPSKEEIAVKQCLKQNINSKEPHKINIKPNHFHENQNGLTIKTILNSTSNDEAKTITDTTQSSTKCNKSNKDSRMTPLTENDLEYWDWKR